MRSVARSVALLSFFLTGPISLPADAKKEDPTVVTVLFVYTPEARDWLGGEAATQAAIELAVEHTNQAFENSQVPLQIEIAFMEETQYQGSWNAFTVRDALVSPSDGKMDEVHDLRDKFFADVVSLLAPISGACGVATEQLLFNPIPQNAPYAFHVVSPSCLQQYTFTHELGHNFGCGHDKGNGNGAFPYAHGHVGSAFRTIMAYGNNQTHPRVLHFSDPDVAYQNQVTGTADENNAKVLDMTREIIAAFRSGSGLACYAGTDKVIVDEDSDGLETVTLKGVVNGGAQGLLQYSWWENGTLLGEESSLTYSFALGTHEVQLQVASLSDPAIGASDLVTVAVVANQPPVAKISAPSKVWDMEGDGTQSVYLWAGSSFDPNGAIAKYEWNIDGIWAGEGISVDVLLSVGTHLIELTVTDSGNPPMQDSAQVSIEVRGYLRVPEDYPTIQAAVDAAEQKDTVWVAPGTYTGPGNRNILVQKRITITSSQGPEKTIVDCGGQFGNQGFVLLPTPNGLSTWDPLVLEGFTIRNAWGPSGGAWWEPPGGGAIALRVASPHQILIRNNRLLKNKAQVGAGIWMFSLTPSFLNAYDAVWLENNVIEGNAAMKGAGVYAFGISGLHFQNNLIVKNVAGGSEGGGGLCLEYVPLCLLFNNTIADNWTSGSGGGILHKSIPANVFSAVNCVVWGNAPGALALEGVGSVTVTYSDVEGGWAGMGNLNSDPLFLCPNASDFRLSAFSPCVDAANGESASPWDLAGKWRYDAPEKANSGIGLPADIGALEYTGALQIVTCILPFAQKGVPYTATLAAEGGSGSTLSWSLAGPLPPGLEFTSEGALQGTPQKSGTYMLTITASELGGASAQKIFYLWVRA